MQLKEIKAAKRNIEDKERVPRGFSAYRIRNITVRYRSVVLGRNVGRTGKIVYAACKANFLAWSCVAPAAIDTANYRS